MQTERVQVLVGGQQCVGPHLGVNGSAQNAAGMIKLCFREDLLDEARCDGNWRHTADDRRLWSEFRACIA